MNAERPNEIDARRIVESTLEIKLNHADTRGGVDYLSAGGDISVEVTRVTDGRKRAGRRALKLSRNAGSLAGHLRECWLVFASETQEGMKTFLQKVNPAIVALEQAGERYFDAQAASVHVLGQSPRAGLYRALLEAGVERAMAAPHRDRPEHIHEVMPLLGSGGSAGGSNDALRRLCAALSEKADNFDKLRDSGAPQRHLFVWIDGDTSYEIERPLSREAPAWADDGFGLPSAAPQLDGSVTHLWVVHEGSRRGWLWDGYQWQALQRR